MAGLISTIKDNKMTSLKYIGMIRGNKEVQDERRKKIDEVSKKYLDLYNNHGFYKISVDSEEMIIFLDDELKTIERFNNIKNKKVIEGFFGKNYKKTIDEMENNIILLMISSMYGFFSIGTDDDLIEKMVNINNNQSNAQQPKPKSLSETRIIISKMFIKRELYSKLIDFIFDEWIPTVFIQSDSDKKKMSIFKNIATALFKKISEKRNPKKAFSNILGVLIKIGVIITATQIAEKSSSSKKTNNMINVFTMAINDIGDIIPDDKCHLKTPSMNFLKIDPELCKYDTKSTWERDYEKCNIQKIKLGKKLKSEIELADSYKKELELTIDELVATKKSRDLWRIVAGVGILLFIIFLVLYIMKKCPTPLDDSPSDSQ